MREREKRSLTGYIANGDGSREPSEKELEIAYTQGENFAKILNTFQRGLSLLPATESAKEVTTEESKPEENKAVPAAVEAAVAAPAATEGATRAIDEATPASKEPITEPVAASKSTDPVVESKATEPAVESKPAEAKKSVSEKPKGEEGIQVFLYVNNLAFQNLHSQFTLYTHIYTYFIYCIFFFTLSNNFIIKKSFILHTQTRV